MSTSDNRLPATEFDPGAQVIPMRGVRPIVIPADAWAPAQADLERLGAAMTQIAATMHELAAQLMVAASAAADAFRDLAVAMGVPQPPPSLSIEDRLFLAAVQANKHRNTGPPPRPPGYRRTA